MTTHEFTVQEAGERLDKVVLAELPQLSRGLIQLMIRDGRITVDRKILKPAERMKGGEVVVVNIPENTTNPIQAEEIPLTILFEDQHLAVVEKPAGLVVHPARGNENGTLVNALLARYPELQDQLASDDELEESRMGIVHRLDKDTSGIMVVARTTTARLHLAEQFHNRTVDKLYYALVERSPKTLTGRIEAPIKRDPGNPRRMRVMAGGRESQTSFEIIDNDFRDGQALLKVKIYTGRTHQIRVHMAFIGCPVVGDALYGFRKRRINMNRHCLHATHLEFNHPITEERMIFDSPLPEDLQEIILALR
jgi:23S rRNA pseudouridine1911/1915/1917 synthase